MQKKEESEDTWGIRQVYALEHSAVLVGPKSVDEYKTYPATPQDIIGLLSTVRPPLYIRVFIMVAIRISAILFASFAILAGATAIPEAAPEPVAEVEVEARAGPTRPCTMWIPQFGVNTVFIKGKKATIKW